MRNQHTREIIFYDCTVIAEPQASTRLSMRHLVERFIEIKDAGKAVQWTKKKRRKVFIRDIAIDEDGDFAWMLMYANDADGSGASFGHLETDEQRDEDKKDGEGRPESSHVLISLKEDPEGSSRYVLLAEETPSIPRSRLLTFLNFMMRACRKANPEDFKENARTGEMRDGALVKAPFLNNFALLGHLSDDFARDLEEGKILGISIETENREFLGFGEGKHLEPTRHQVKLKPIESWKDQPVRLIAEALRMGKANNYESARIVFQTSDKNSHTAILDTDSGDVRGDGYLKRVRITIREEYLKDASPTFVARIKDRMLELFERHRDVHAGDRDATLPAVAPARLRRN